MHGGHSSEDEPMAEINMIPLIDIALTLLIILMVTTTFARKPGVNLKLPETATREGAQETPKDLIVAVSSLGDLYLDGQPVSPETLQSRLREKALQDKDARVMIRGDRSVMYARMMEVMDMIRQAGLTRVILPTDPKTLLQAPPSDPTRGTPFAPNTVPATGTPSSNGTTPSTGADTAPLNGVNAPGNGTVVTPSTGTTAPTTGTTPTNDRTSNTQETRTP
jgi:biopolymer transport protein ExbD